MTTHALTPDLESRRSRLGDQALRSALVRFVRHRLPGGDAEDVVQDTLIDALAASRAPNDPVDLRRWVFGIARRKVADRAAQAPKRTVVPRDEDGAVPPQGEMDAVDIVRWARDEVSNDPEDVRTLGWMVREGVFGETLATIAHEAGLPQPQVRQRVSRLRRFLRERWAAQAGVAVFAIVVLAVLWGSSLHGPRENVRADGVVMVDTNAREASRLRDEAKSACDAEQWIACEQALDQAKRLDPNGETAPWILRLRTLLERMLRPAPRPAPVLPAPDVPLRVPAPPTGTLGAAPLSPPPPSDPTCPCPERDPMCGCLPGMGADIVAPSP